MPGPAHAQALRRARFSNPGQHYLITCVVQARMRVFSDAGIGRRLAMHMRRLHDDGIVHSLAWVIMPDHLHWLFELRRGSLPETLRLLKGRSACEINKACGARTLVWQKGYHDHAVRTDEDLRVMTRYIIANPIRAGLVEHEGDYPLWDTVWT